MSFASCSMRVRKARACSGVVIHPERVGNSWGRNVSWTQSSDHNEETATVRLCCKKEGDQVSSASIREKQRSLLHEPATPLQMASFPSRHHSPVCALVSALCASATVISKRSCSNEGCMWITRPCIAGFNSMLLNLIGAAVPI